MFSNSKQYRQDIKNIAEFDTDWGDLNDATILVTGATGLIGTVLIDSLMYRNKMHGSGVMVVAVSRSMDRLHNRFPDYIDNPLFIPVEGDVTEPLDIKQNVNYIINLASNTHPGLYASEPINTINTIISGIESILELAAANQSRRVINISSVEIYGENIGGVQRFKEDYCGYINCNTLRAGYTEAKRVSEAICQAYIAEKGVDVVSARPGRVYGPTMLESDTKSTSQFIRNAVNGEDIILRSDGGQRWSYVYVADVVTAIFSLLTRGRVGEAYNVADDEVKTLRETAEILAGINSRQVTFELPDDITIQGGSKVQSALMDSTKIKGLGWQAKYDLVNGLRRTVEIMRNNNGRS